MVSGKYVYAGKKRCAKYQKFILIPDNASWYTAIRSESLIKANYKIVKRLFGLNYILQKYHRSVSNVGLLLAYNLCMQIVKKLGREKMFAMACTFPIIGLIIIAVAGFVAPTNPLFVILGAGILKLGSGFELGVVTVCIADVIDYNELLFGTRNESIICSTQTFLMKASQAVSGLLTGVGLAMVGYNASLPQQSAATLNGIRIIMIVIPMVFAVISYLIYEKAYKLKGDYLDNMTKELNVIHEA